MSRLTKSLHYVNCIYGSKDISGFVYFLVFFGQPRAGYFLFILNSFLLKYIWQGNLFTFWIYIGILSFNFEEFSTQIYLTRKSIHIMNIYILVCKSDRQLEQPSGNQEPKASINLRIGLTSTWNNQDKCYVYRNIHYTKSCYQNIQI